MNKAQLLLKLGEGLALLDKKRALLCAVSGGPDSMLLLWALNELAKENGFFLTAAHLHHGIRGEEADRDAAFVREYCEENNIPLISKREDIPAMAQKKGQSIELAARLCRRRFLLDAMEECVAEIIVLGHHANDQAETILLNLIRGTGLLGLCGMPEYNPPWWRPFLSYKRVDLQSAADAWGIPYRIDSSNDSDDYRRNRLRKTLENLEKENPNLALNFFQSSQLLAQDEAYLQKQAQKELAELKTEKGLNSEAVLELDSAISSRVLRAFLKEKGFAQDIEHKHIILLQNAIEKGENAFFDLPGGRRLTLEYGELFFAEKVKSFADAIPFNVQGETETPWGIFVCKEASLPKRWSDAKDNTVYASKDALEGAYLRNRLQSDWIQPFGMTGKKKLKDFYMDKKTPKTQRQGPLLSVQKMAGEILWVVGQGLSQKCACNNGKKIVQISFFPYDKEGNHQQIAQEE